MLRTNLWNIVFAEKSQVNPNIALRTTERLLWINQHSPLVGEYMSCKGECDEEVTSDCSPSKLLKCVK